MDEDERESREFVDDVVAKPPSFGEDNRGTRSHDQCSFEITKLTREGCWLYSHVAMSTITEPRTKVMDILKSKRATDARNEMTMLRLVANPFRMLSEYLMTMAVTNPPNTWTNTVAHAHAPKSWNRLEKKPSPV